VIFAIAVSHNYRCGLGATGIRHDAISARRWEWHDAGTTPGLLTFPLALGSLVASTGAGLIISKFGKWKRFLVISGVLLTASMVLMGSVDHYTPITHVMIYMAMTGFGMGMMMQNLVLAVQNTVDVTQVGAAGAAVSFVRSLVALGPAGADAAARMQSGGSSELDFDTLPASIATIVRSAYGDATGRIFMIAAAMALLSLISVLSIKEVPLRRTVRQTPAAAADDGSASTGDRVGASV